MYLYSVKILVYFFLSDQTIYNTKLQNSKYTIEQKLVCNGIIYNNIVLPNKNLLDLPVIFIQHLYFK